MHAAAAGKNSSNTKANHFLIQVETTTIAFARSAQAIQVVEGNAAVSQRKIAAISVRSQRLSN